MSTHPLRFYTSRAPREKFRGRRRYFDRVQRDAETFCLDFKDWTGFNYWHYHADWPGWGNLGWRHRLPHLRALCTVFQKIADARDRFDRFAMPFQTWIAISEEDAGTDATYIHSPNATSPFPYQPEAVEIEASVLAPCFRQLLPELDLHVGWSRVPNDDETTWFTTHLVWAQGVGVPLWDG
jgi:hypothetical protein